MAHWTQIRIHLVVAIATFVALVQSHGGEMHNSADKCGVTKGCFREPVGCTGSEDCTLFTSWTLDEDMNNVFVVSGKTQGYVALGFSKSGGMKNSDVYACTKNKEVIRSHNIKKDYNSILAPKKGVSNEHVSVVNGKIECSFTRLAWIDDNDDTYYDLRENNTYTFIMAKSDSVTAEGGVVYHDTREYSTEEISFTDFQGGGNSGGEEGLNLQKAHGSLMVTAWVGFASLGIVMARFFKPMWPNTKICGVAVWFVLHRTFMVMASLCTMAAFIIIFIHVGAFFSPEPDLARFLHAVFGTVVTACVIINPVMALFRPHPGEPRRKLFNWAHWAVGTGGHTIAMVTIILGLNKGDFRSLIDDLPSRVFWVMIAFLVFHYAMWLLFEIQRCMTESQGRNNDIPLSGNDKGSSQQALTPNSEGYQPPPEATTIMLPPSFDIGFPSIHTLRRGTDDAYRDDRSCQTTKESKSRQEPGEKAALLVHKDVPSISKESHVEFDPEGSMAKTALLVVYVSGVLFTVMFIVISVITVGM